ncbi:hypothetical protein HPP92_004880 [Vanilla planifolia]|uniref:Uncharacterized protein n=1 Tax=Vanilla planifolia TaxID=51239 RepID=A0A835VEV2_VANPL|nr:hypothetical protein HPP92_004880 [Vanilla planifolia]
MTMKTMRDGMPEEAEEDDKEDDDGVVHREVVAVGADPEIGLAEVRWEGERVGVDHLAPWTASRKRRSAAFLGPGNEAQWRGVYGSCGDRSVVRHPVVRSASPERASGLTMNLRCYGNNGVGGRRIFGSR